MTAYTVLLHDDNGGHTIGRNLPTIIDAIVIGIAVLKDPTTTVLAVYPCDTDGYPTGTPPVWTGAPTNTPPV